MIEVGIILVETALLVSAGLVGANLLRKLEAAEEYVEELETSNE